MRFNRGRGGVFANPVLVGAVTLLIVNVATVLAWFANRGLPFVPTRQVNIELPNGANLLPGNEVREGGFRIGIVSDMDPVPLRGGGLGAVAKLKLDQKNSEVPIDSTVNIRPRSVLGLKYVELNKGSSKTMLQDGDTLPVEQAKIPIELDELYNIFDERTREGSRKNLRGFGDALANRGLSLNRTIEELPRFLEHLEPVMEVLSDPETGLASFFGELGDFTRVLDPLADRYAHSFTAGADTFEAWSRDPEALKETISRSVPAMDAGIRSFRIQRPFLVALRDFSVALDETARELPRTLPRIISALETGLPVIKRTPPINEELRKTFVSLDALMTQPQTGQSLRALTGTVNSLNPTVRFLGPYITVCNYFNYSWTNVAEHLTEPDPTGGSQRTLLNQAAQQIDERNNQRTGVGVLGSPFPANGGRVVGNGTPQFLHSNNYSAAIDDQGNADCESGQRGYIERANAYSDDKDLKIVVDPHIPGNQGTTFTGRPRVPAGQTFSRQPQLGPRIPKELDP